MYRYAAFMQYMQAYATPVGFEHVYHRTLVPLIKLGSYSRRVDIGK
jgi:hypothetical protein